MELMKTQRDGKIIINEIRKELKNFNSSKVYGNNKMKELLASIENNTMMKSDYLQLHNYFASTRDYYKGVYNKADISKDSLLRSYIKPSKKLTNKLKGYKKDKTISSKEYRSYKKLISNLKDYNFQEFKNKYNNHSLEDFVTNSNSLSFIDEDETGLIQKSDPIYLDPVGNNYLGAQFYAPIKISFWKEINTFTANLFVIWLMTIILPITLYFDVLRKY